MSIREEGFTYRLEEGVAHVTLSRPDRINALTFGSYRALTDAFREMHETAAVRAVVLSGEGRNMFINLGLALGTSALFYAGNFLSQYLGDNAVLSPELAAWFPLIAFGTIAVARWDTIRT